MCDMMATAMSSPLEAYRRAYSRGPFPRSGLFYGWDPDEPLADLREDERDGSARVAGVKVLMDGTYTNRTAWVCDPYPDSCDQGMRTITDEDLRSAADWARRNRVQLAVHAMGDKAINHVVDILGGRDPWLSSRPSVRIEHATIMAPDLVARLVSSPMSFGIATHSIFLFAEYEAYAKNLRPGLMPDAYPLRRLYGEIEPLALSSDCPATSWGDADNPFVSIQAAVTRRAHTGADIGFASALTVSQAILLYTARAAELTEIDGLGQLAPGRRGSFIVLDRDVFSIPSDEISQICIDETWVDGNLVHHRE